MQQETTLFRAASLGPISQRILVMAGLAAAVLWLVLTSPEADASENLSGDVDCNGSVEALDATGVLRDVGILAAPDCIIAGDVDCDGDRDGMDALLILRFIVALAVETGGGCPAIATPIDGGGVLPLSFSVDPDVEPNDQMIEGIDGGPARQLASIRDSRGNQADFVEDELLLQTDDPQVLNDFIARWNGEVIMTFKAGQAARVQSAGISYPDLHLVRIDTSLASPNLLPALIRELDSGARGEHFVSSPEGLGLLAAAAAEGDGGGIVGINWVMYGHTLRERTTTEAATGPGGFSSDAYDWNYFNRGSTQDIGVTEAWTALVKTSKLGNKSTIAILDGGFSPNDDFPEIVERFGAPDNRANPVSCSGGASCPFHGTNVLHAAMGVPDNSFGVAGPGGPVARAITFGGGWDTMTAAVAVVQVRQAGADIINMSFGSAVPASLSWSVAPFNRATALVAASGALIFAAAGNDGENVDAEDCAVFCWEEAWHKPCENSGVICVGALGWDSRLNASYSNWGFEDVDIFAPGTVFVGPDFVTPGVSSKSGTSFASPFVAGVAALIWAADPTLSANEVIGLLMTHAHDSPALVVERYVNAWGSVKAALGGNTPPNLDVQTPVEGATYSLGSELISFSAVATDDEDITPTVTWTSHRDGLVGTGTLVQRNDLSVGIHIMTATATDSRGFEDFEHFTFEVIDDPPFVEITNPPHESEFFQGQTIYLTATTRDTNLVPPAPLPDADVRWSRDDVQFATGHNVTIPGGTLPLGIHTIYVDAYEGELTSWDGVTITINEDPPDLPPDVVITSPENGATFLVNASDGGGDYRNVTVVGSANDPEDGALSGDSLQWHYRPAGAGIYQPVGTGASRNIKLYATDCFGTDYDIRLTAIDSNSNISTFRITVTITSLC